MIRGTVRANMGTAALDAPPAIANLLDMDVTELTGAEADAIADFLEERADVHLRESVRLEAEAALMPDDDEEGDRT